MMPLRHPALQRGNVRHSSLATRHLAFTLVELLVVMAIISLLASLLMPALKNARASAKSAVCVSNLRQIYLSLANFANDNDGFLPEHWANGHIFVPTDFSVMTSWPIYMNLPKSQIPYGLQRSEHWRCPGTFVISDLYPADGSSASSSHRMWQSNPYVFTKQYAVAPYGDPSASLNPSSDPALSADFSRATQLTLLGAPAAWLFDEVNWVRFDGKPYMHGKNANFLMGDGHVEPRPAEQW